MDRTEQKKTKDTPVVSPLAQDKTYGERKFSLVVDWGLNYWTNLLASAGFSQWAEHGTRPIKLPFIDKPFPSPRVLQEKLATSISKGFFMKGLHNATFAEKIAELGTVTDAGVAAAKEATKEVVAARSMARARSLTLLTPGYLVMIPAVWLGAKIKPAVVEWLDRRHYGAEAMDDPSLIARHQAIAAEERPTFLGTLIARIGTTLAVQVAAQSVGSNNNKINKLGKKLDNEFMSNFAIDPITERIGYSLGGAAPAKLQARYNNFASHHGLKPSVAQIKEATEFVSKNSARHAASLLNPHEQIEMQRATDVLAGKYTTATQDLGRFIVADTVYTLITAMLIRPAVKLLRSIPGMSYKPKVAADSAVFDSDGNRIKVPNNRYADMATESLDRAPGVSTLAAAEQGVTTPNPKPKPTVANIEHMSTLAARTEPQIA
jgi:hypothetical protein